ncbi:5-deoxy-glucuronate isomerase [Arenibaculum pallidiluteum]|uniref:5-deoxy-glucuronate isomerase n=1 Tax=Arenibaculum pallidiluteum TaxID=2812559 RepID=UPI001A95711D|nr:5-deoxy-glucuronate isomerase [Arenibaculum pallidiluteum]
MSQLLLRNHAPDAAGLVHRVTPETAGWTYVGFELHRLERGQTVAHAGDGRETCLVLVGGRAAIAAGDLRWDDVGERMGPFEGRKPHSVYVPAGAPWRVEARTPVELAVCTAPGLGGGLPPRLIAPDDVPYIRRGEGTNTRHVHDILSQTAPADSLLVVEVITPAGNWSSYPPHKHDVDAIPEESQLEETYYHRIDPPQGFAFQRVYTDDRSLDETMTVQDGDVVLVPRGYHPVGAAHGYQLYYLNVMAGPRRAWHFRTAAEHAWMLR